MFGWIGSICSAIGSGISSFVSGVSSFVGSGIRFLSNSLGGLVTATVKSLGSIGGALAGKASALLGGITAALTPILGPLAPIVTNLAVNFLTNLACKALSSNETEEMEPEEVEEYGALLEEAQKHPEWDGADAFTSAKGHMAYLKGRVEEENITIPEAKPLSVESLKRRGLGMTELWTRFEKQENIEVNAEVLINTAIRGLDEDEFKAMITTAKELNYASVPNLDSKFGNMSPDERERFNEVYVAKLRELKENVGVTLSIEEAYEKAYTLSEPVKKEDLEEVFVEPLIAYEELGENLFDPENYRNELIALNMPEDLEKLDKALEEK